MHRQNDLRPLVCRSRPVGRLPQTRTCRGPGFHSSGRSIRCESSQPESHWSQMQVLVWHCMSSVQHRLEMNSLQACLPSLNILLLLGTAPSNFIKHSTKQSSHPQPPTFQLRQIPNSSNFAQIQISSTQINYPKCIFICIISRICSITGLRSYLRNTNSPFHPSPYPAPTEQNLTLPLIQPNQAPSCPFSAHSAH